VILNFFSLFVYFVTDKKDMAALTKLCQASASLNKLNISGCSIPQDSLRDFLLAISRNVYMQNVELNLARNGLGLEGVKSIISVISEAVNIEKLDVSDNELGDEVCSHNLPKKKKSNN
jgi:Ran GTPase-activating protein (RanGAP) involved in mRNA processing and transport